jgi:hypothetical protein
MYHCLQMKVDPKARLPAGASASIRSCGSINSPMNCCPDLDPNPPPLRQAQLSCASDQGPGHPIWFLTFMSGGKRRVERIPKEWVEDIRRRVEAGRAMQEAIKEMLTANAELLVLWRRQKGL